MRALSEREIPMKGYETIFITHPELEGDNLTKLLNKFKKLIKKSKGKLLHENIWGRRKLAYPIANQKFGVYHVWYLTGGGEMLEELQKQFRFSDEVIRFQTVTVEDLEQEALYFSEMLNVQEEEAVSRAAKVSTVAKPNSQEKRPEETKIEQKAEETIIEEGKTQEQIEVETLEQEPKKVSSNIENTEA